jgi:mRNA interferase MazF
VAVPAGLPVSGVVLSDHIKSLDWRARKAEWAFTLPPQTTAEILGKLQTLLR